MRGMSTIEGFLSFEELGEALRHVSYKPGWTFRLISGYWEGDRLRIVVEGLADSYHPERTTDLGVDDFIPPMRTTKDFYDYLLYRVHRIESHETREWFKVDGKPHDDPHKERKK